MGFQKGNKLGKKFKKGDKIWLGKNHTLESRKKMSLNMKGLKKSDEHKRKLSLIHIGKKVSEETKNKLRQLTKYKRYNYKGLDDQYCIVCNEKLNRGRHSKRCRTCAGIEKRGYKNSRWTGLTPIVKQIRQCFKMRQWKSDVFTRDNYTCQNCFIRGSYLEAHHLKQFKTIINEYKLYTLEKALECSELWDINNGQTLCRDCHNKTKWKK